MISDWAFYRPRGFKWTMLVTCPGLCGLLFCPFGLCFDRWWPHCHESCADKRSRDGPPCQSSLQLVSAIRPCNILSPKNVSPIWSFLSQLPDLSTDDLNGRRTAVTSSLSLIKRVNETFHEAVNYGKIGFGRPTALRPGGRVARFPSPIRGHTHVR